MGSNNNNNSALLLLPAAIGSGYFWRKRHNESRGDEYEYLAGIGAISFGSMFLRSVPSIVWGNNPIHLQHKVIIGVLVSIMSAFLVVGFSASYARGFFYQNKTASSLFVSMFILINALNGVIMSNMAYRSFAGTLSVMSGGQSPFLSHFLPS